MDKAKAALSSFTGRSGQKDTTVHENIAPAVQHEVIKPHEHEEVHKAIDREVHQDHYHRTVQPIQDREVLPEQHTANLGAVQHVELDHRDQDYTKHALEAEQSDFKDERVVDATSKSQSAAATVAGEHVHHHVHETIQPVVHKETVQPHVVHTTVPIHEVHHNAAKHHNTSELPAMTMGDFKKKGGVLGGRQERYDEFQGEPKNIGGNLMKGMGMGHGHAKRDSAYDDSMTNEPGMKMAAQHGDFQPKNAHAGELGAKPSMMEKLNPSIDADGDGKRGIMD